jgi:hypothetical protein
MKKNQQPTVKKTREGSKALTTRTLSEKELALTTGAGIVVSGGGIKKFGD